MSVSAPAAGLLRFDNFELDVRAGELRKRGVKLRLQGQPLQVLATLLRHSGELVTREELRTEIWPVDTFVDFDHSLHNAIARIREALGTVVHTSDCSICCQGLNRVEPPRTSGRRSDPVFF